jgi:hypothetical protein
MNSDGLHVKFGAEEAAHGRGGEFAALDNGRHVIEFTIDWKDALSATNAILGSAATVAYPQTGSKGVVIPEGFIPEFLEVTPVVAFTSSGTIGSATLVIGSKKLSDRSTEFDHDGLATTSFAASVLDATAEGPTVIKVGTTGAGDDYGVAYTENVVISCSNSQHGSHPYTAGVAKCRLVGRFGLATV